MSDPSQKNFAPISQERSVFEKILDLYCLENPGERKNVPPDVIEEFAKRNHLNSDELRTLDIPILEEFTGEKENRDKDATLMLRRFLAVSHANVSYAVWRSLMSSARYAFANAEIRGTAIVDVASVFLEIIGVAEWDRKRGFVDRSLPIAIEQALKYDQVRLYVQRARSFRLNMSIGNYEELIESDKGDVIFDHKVHVLISHANEFRSSFSNDHREEWVAARHLLASMLFMFSSDDSVRHTLGFAGFDPRIILGALRRNIELYSDRDDVEKWEKYLERFETLSSASRLLVGQGMNASRNPSSKELCLNIKEDASSIADLLSAAGEESDVVFALYAPWGRGKTTLIDKVEALISKEEILSVRQRFAKTFSKDPQSLKREEIYKVVRFSAWKYPTRPEVWIHLYQTIAAAAGSHGFFQKLRIGFRIGLLEKNWWPILIGLFLLLLSRFQFEIGGWFFDAVGILGMLIITSFVWKAATTGKVLTRYVTMPDHAEKLGLQSVIGRDLKHLLKVWIQPQTEKNEPIREKSLLDNRIDPFDFSRTFPLLALVATILLIWLTLGAVGWKVSYVKATEASQDAIQSLKNDLVEIRQKLGIPNKSEDFGVAKTLTEKANLQYPVYLLLGMVGIASTWFVIMAALRPNKHSRMLLVVDDLDRCEPEQMLAVMESLRPFLDQAEMQKRLQVAMLLDRRIFARVILQKGRACGLIREGDAASAKKFLREQEEKLFVASLQLPNMSKAEIKNFVEKHVDRELSADTVITRTDVSFDKDSISSPEVGSNERGDVDVSDGTIKDKDFSKRGPQNREKNTEAPPSTSRLTLEEPEREYLKKIMSDLNPSGLTPRSLRSFVLRYQLARLILIKRNVDITDIKVIHGVIEGLAARLFDWTGQQSAVSADVTSAIDRVAFTDEEVADIGATTPVSEI